MPSPALTSLLDALSSPLLPLVKLSTAEKVAYACQSMKSGAQVMGLVELEPLSNVIIGMPGSGLSIEARKRCSIAVELVANPGEAPIVHAACMLPVALCMLPACCLLCCMCCLPLLLGQAYAT